MTIFEDEIVNNKAFEHSNQIFTEPWVLANNIMLNIMQNFKFFSKTNFRPTGVLKNDTSILRKNDWFSNKTCCCLTALFLKTKIYFCHCNFVNKQINKNAKYRFSLLTVANI